MDRARYSFIAHASHDYCNPVSGATVERVLSIVALKEGGSVLDVGCGKGELLVRGAERFRARGVGVDVSELFVAEARARIAARGQGGRVVVHRGEAREFMDTDGGGYDCACCVGSTHALGGLAGTLDALKRAARPGGWILVGEGYWKRPPDAGYLQALGATPGDYGTHADNVSAGVRAGLVPMHAACASESEWDEHEWAYCRNVEEFASRHPADPDAAAMLERARSWRDVVLKWGRDTLGFGLYLFRVPDKG